MVRIAYVEKRGNNVYGSPAECLASNIPPIVHQIYKSQLNRPKMEKVLHLKTLPDKDLLHKVSDQVDQPYGGYGCYKIINSRTTPNTLRGVLSRMIVANC